MLYPVYQFSEAWLKEIVCSRLDKKDVAKRRKLSYEKENEFLRGYKWEMIKENHSNEEENVVEVKTGSTIVKRKKMEETMRYIMSVQVSQNSQESVGSCKYKEIIEVKKLCRTDKSDRGMKSVSGEKKSIKGNNLYTFEKTKVFALCNFKRASIITSLSEMGGHKSNVTKSSAFNLGGLHIHELFASEDGRCEDAKVNAVLTSSAVVRCLRDINKGEEIRIIRKVEANHPFNLLDCLILSEAYKGAIASTCIGKVIDVSNNVADPLFTVCYSNNTMEYLNRKAIIERIIYAEKK